jgi:hypothetical protein
MTEEWVEVTNIKKLKYQNRRNQRSEEQERWRELRTSFPWIIVPSRAQRIRRKLNISLLDEKLLSEEWILYQKQGWNYIRVVRPDDDTPIPSNTDTIEYSVLDVNNKWGDRVLFARSQNMEGENGWKIVVACSDD